MSRFFALNYAAAIACVYLAIRAIQFGSTTATSIILGIAFLYLSFLIGFGQLKEKGPLIPLVLLGLAVLVLSLELGNNVQATASLDINGGTLDVTTLLENGNAVPNATDNLSFFSPTTSAELAGVISDETGTGLLVFGTSPTISGAPTAAGATWADLGSVTTVDINGGTIDGVTIGGTTAGAGTFTDLTINSSGNILDDILFTFGTSNDIAQLLRSTSLGQDVELTGVIVGTSEHSAYSANTLITSNITENGDMAFLVNTGGNSKEWLTIDTSVVRIRLGLDTTTGDPAFVGSPGIVLDTPNGRNTHHIALLPMNGSFAAGAEAISSAIRLGPYTETFTSTTQVTGLMAGIRFSDGWTITNASAHTIDKAAMMALMAPIEAGSVSLTHSSGLRVLNTSGTPVAQAGVYIEDLTSGGSDYGIYIEDADTASIWVDSGTSNFGGNIVYNHPTAAASNDLNIDNNNIIHQVSSSRKFKVNERPLEQSFTGLYNVPVKTFEWGSNTLSSGITDFGVIAEEVAAVSPDLVTWQQEEERVFNEDGSLVTERTELSPSTPQAVRTQPFLWALLSLIQEQDARIKALEAK